MTTETATADATPTPAPADAPKPAEDAQEGLTDTDRDKLMGVVKKERGAAKEATSRAEKAEKQLAEMKSAETRRGVAETLDLTPEQATFLTGETPEEMTASAEALLAAFVPKPDIKRRPVEKALRTGATSLTEGAPNMAEVAARVMD